MFKHSDLKIRRRELLDNPTYFENEFKDKIKSVTFKEQLILGFYIVDFCFPTKLLIVEIDGYVHQDRIKKDIQKDKFLNNCGFTVLRLKNEDVAKFDFNDIIKLPTVKGFKSSQSKASSRANMALRRQIKSNPEYKNSLKTRKSNLLDIRD